MQEASVNSQGAIMSKKLISFFDCVRVLDQMIAEDLCHSSLSKISHDMLLNKGDKYVWIIEKISGWITWGMYMGGFQTGCSFLMKLLFSFI